MNVHIGSTTDDPRKLTKTITWITNGQGTTQDFSCVPTADCDIINPTIVLAYDSNIVDKNYAEISDWGRKYFINDIQMLTGGRMMLVLSVDVLSTYDTSIRACNGTMTRATWAGRNMVPDNQFPLYTNQRQVYVATFSGRPFTPVTGSYVIQTVGGDGYTPP